MPDTETDPPSAPGQLRQLAASFQDDAGALCLAAAQLAGRHLRFDSADPLWPDRDRIVADDAFAALARAINGLAGSDQLCTIQRLAIGCGAGLALAERLLAARFGRSLVDHRTWVLCAGATLASGPVQEAAWLAGSWRLGRLTVIADTPDGQPPGAACFAAAGWTVRRAGAADPAEVAAALSAALRSQKPTLILCTGQHGRLDADGRAGPVWETAGRRSAGMRRAWLKRLARHGSRQDFDRAMAGRLHGRWHAPLSEPGPLVQAGQTEAASTAVVMRALAALPAGMPELAMLPGTAGWALPPAQTEPPLPSRALAGLLAHGTGAALCGTALHGGLMPVSVQDAASLDAILPALRAAAAACTRLLQVIVQPDSQQAGQHAALESIPNLQVFRPADASEALECLELAFRHTEGPSVLLLAERKLPLLAGGPARTRCARGGYVAADSPGPRDVTLLASGQEMDLALQARVLLLRRGIQAAVVSLPCWSLFAQQDAGWRSGVLGVAPRVAVACDGGFGWDRWLGDSGVILQPGGGAAKLTDAVARHLAYGVSV